MLSGSWQIPVSGNDNVSLPLLVFYNYYTKRISIAGINRKKTSIILNESMSHLPPLSHLDLYYTNDTKNPFKNKGGIITGKSFEVVVPPNCIFTLTDVGRQDLSSKKNKTKIQNTNCPCQHLLVWISCMKRLIIKAKEKLLVRYSPKNSFLTIFNIEPPG